MVTQPKLSKLLNICVPALLNHRGGKKNDQTFHQSEKQAGLDDQYPRRVRARRCGRAQHIWDHSARRNDGPVGETKQMRNRRRNDFTGG